MADEDGPRVEPTDCVATTQHAMSVGRGALDYRAEAGTLVLRDRDGKPKCTMGFAAYVRTGGAPDRPVTFVFNGGPGSSSVWLHLGLFGPRRVVVDNTAAGSAPPYQLVDNEHTLLDVSDLVFIDPVSTGHSRAVEGEDPKNFHGVIEDAEWVSEFIRLWTGRNARWASPKFLAGESYGTIRAAHVTNRLQERFGMELNGIVLIGACLWFQTLSFVPGNDLGYVLALPSLAAAAHFHGRLPGAPKLPKLLAEVEEFALGPYAQHLLAGSRAPKDERGQMVARLATYTGLTPQFIDLADARITVDHFRKALLRPERRSVGRLDARFTGIDPDPLAADVEFDPSFSAIRGAYATTFNHYLHDELGVRTDMIYEFYDQATTWPWKMGDDGTNRFLDAGHPTRLSMIKNPQLRVFVASGLYDLAIPYLSTEWTIDHLGIDAA
ncbi:MAG: peptidase S10, partial [Actinobacteria bacterium]|nr:peptidase S10 [Actinomycetota bacterium]